MTLLLGHLALLPPPTSASMLHLKSISTIPIPPLSSITHKKVSVMINRLEHQVHMTSARSLRSFAVLRYCTHKQVHELTSYKLTLEWDRVEDSEAILSADSKTVLILVEPNILNVLWTCRSVYHFRIILQFI